jgi:hypothetical protein
MIPDLALIPTSRVFACFTKDYIPPNKQASADYGILLCIPLNYLFVPFLQLTLSSLEISPTRTKQRQKTINTSLTKSKVFFLSTFAVSDLKKTLRHFETWLYWLNKRF